MNDAAVQREQELRTVLELKIVTLSVGLHHRVVEVRELGRGRRDEGLPLPGSAPSPLDAAAAPASGLRAARRSGSADLLIGREDDDEDFLTAARVEGSCAPPRDARGSAFLVSERGAFPWAVLGFHSCRSRQSESWGTQPAYAKGHEHDRRFQGHRRENIPVSGCSGRAWSCAANVTGLRITLEWLWPSTEASARGKDGADMHYRLEVTMASGCPWDIVLDPLFCCPPGELPWTVRCARRRSPRLRVREVLARAGTLPQEGAGVAKEQFFPTTGERLVSSTVETTAVLGLRLGARPAVWRTRRPSPPGSSALHAGQDPQPAGSGSRHLEATSGQALHRLGARPAHTTLLPARRLVLGRCSCPSRRTHSVRRRDAGFRHFQSRTSGMSWLWVSMYRWRWTSLSCTVCSRQLPLVPHCRGLFIMLVKP